jgi:cytochrome b561
MVHRARYGAVAQFFHSATAVFVLIAFTFGPGGSEQRVYAHARDFDRQLHETLGLCVFALVAMRVLWRIVDRQPEPPQVSLWSGQSWNIGTRARVLLRPWSSEWRGQPATGA